MKSMIKKIDMVQQAHHKRWGAQRLHSLILFLILGNCTIYSMSSEFTYSRAVSAAQKGDLQRAQEKMSSLLVNDPDRADVAYDCGVVAYQKKEFEKAEAYFSKVAQSAQASKDLKKQALFNRGNSHVALKQLEKAVSDYQEALKLDAHDERVKHNLQRVMQMLQKEQQQDQKNQDNDKKQDQKSDKNNKDQKNDQQKQDQKNQQSGDGQQQDQDGGSQQNQKQDSKSDKNKKENDKNKDGQKQDQKNQQAGDEEKDNNDLGGVEKKEEQKSDEQQKGDQKDDAQDGSEGDDGDKQQEQFGNNHASTPQENKSDNGSQPTQAGQKEQEMQQGQVIPDYRQEEKKKLEESLSPQDRWMARVLERTDKRDEKVNKQMIKTTIDKNTAGKHGQNNW